ncbi:MAG: AAA family ATPase [Chloroflexi bacterium]|nr:MAG: AAA family ATPase [Chloroflexota bacterium]
MTIPATTREALLESLEKFDRDIRSLPEWVGWETNGNYEHGISFDGHLYPPKQIITMATGLPKNQFSGGPEANGYLTSYGFEIVPLRAGITSIAAVNSAGIATPPSVTGPTYAAARLFIASALRSDGSLFTPDRLIWTLPVVEDLYERFVGQPDTSSDSFEVKFRRQLAGAPAETIQLAGELLFVHFLIASNIGGEAKRRLINEVLSWSPSKVSIPPALDSGLDHGLVDTGVAFNTYRPYQLWFLLEFAKSWKATDPSARNQMLADPWTFKQFAFSLPITAAYTQREALLHLVFPDAFEPITSRDVKALIGQRLRGRVANPSGDIDRLLAQIREALLPEFGTNFHFYEPQVAALWQSPVRDRTTQQHAWFIRCEGDLADVLVKAWLDDGFVSIGWREAGDIPVGTSGTVIAVRVRESYSEASPGSIRAAAGNIDRFLNRIGVGDLVVTILATDVYVGVIDSTPIFVETDHPNDSRRRRVSWANAHTPIKRESLPSDTTARLRTRLTVTDVSEDLALYQERAKLAAPALVSLLEDVRLPPVPAEVHLPAVSTELADELMLPRQWLQNIVDLLEEKRQLILYGPPGTGKTYIAQALADFLTGGQRRLVQFHPSYSYEDFVEGFRPAGVSGAVGAVGFDLVPGPFRRIAEEALAERTRAHILVIDEINRANIAKVFGELYFLLEYRDEPVQLLYSPAEDFHLPKNLFLIGTMNSADRSIALLDMAMRRRFFFVPLFPQEEPIRGLLRRWLEKNLMSTEAADLLGKLNELIFATGTKDRDFAVGPSYFMTKALAAPESLERIWSYALMPLLEEQYYGTEDDVTTAFSLRSVRAALQRAPDGDQADAPKPDPPK